MAVLVPRIKCGPREAYTDEYYWMSIIDALECCQKMGGRIPAGKGLFLCLLAETDIPDALKVQFGYICYPFPLDPPAGRGILITTPSLWGDERLRQMGFTLPPDSITMKQVASAVKRGAVGAVVRPEYAERIRRTFGKRLLLLAPGSPVDGYDVDFWLEGMPTFFSG